MAAPLASCSPPSTAWGRFFIVVWAADRERPLYACASHTPPSAPSTQLEDSTPPVNVVALYRFFSSLALLSAAPPGENAEPTAVHASLTSSTVPGVRLGGGSADGASLPCAFAATPLCCVAVLAATATAAAGVPPAASQDFLKWVAVGVLESLQPAAWQGGPTALHVSGAPPPYRSFFYLPPHTHPDLAARLAHVWKQERAKAQVAAAAMETYGAREVLAETHSASLLKTFVDAAQRRGEDDDVAPVATAVQTYLTRWWLPFARAPLGSSLPPQLVGYFSVVSAPPPAAERLTPAPFTATVALPPLTCLPQYAAAIQLLSSSCHEHQRGGLLMEDEGITAVVVRLHSTAALVALDTGIVLAEGVRVFQVSHVCHRKHRRYFGDRGNDGGDGQLCRISMLRHGSAACMVRDNSSLWSEEVLREMW
ncbi:hypothetical protein ABL78_4468 [Leptomonas seymouri]|uniref:Uncharacterized protein n=1 Tax=Leptomonas seymouri TaxID=5684 RepID=A0A0N1IKQ2_LEPSE|nr:hypothetical protein ABL78_4468 [Leptomonas seymouri]|eukprot:KPI86484.1 hypothetical protein ABL78_4468 [Leptomonas seymouri]